MAIQIIDGFQVNVASPIDSRIVASGSAARNAIPYKYHGLRVFDISNNIPYVWNGSSWVSENASSIAGSGTLNYIPLYTDVSVISNSYLYQDFDNEDIRTSDIGSGDGLVQISPHGTVLASNGFYGPAYGITNINANQITAGTLALNRLTNGSTGWLLSGGSGQPVYVNPTQITVGTASVATQSSITNTTSNTNNFVTFVSSSSGNNQVRVSSTGLLYNPGTNVLTTGTVSSNAIKFPSTQISSTDVNSLDDYEEGTWTPIISGDITGFTYNSGGMYTKIGRLIHISGYIKYLAISSPGPDAEKNYISVSNLPTWPIGAGVIPVQSASVGIWCTNEPTASGNFPDQIRSGAVISSYQVSNDNRIYFTADTASNNPLSGYVPSDTVVSFSLTFHNNQ